eukprot:scaffold23163_cov62-Attheya_sp.AAC.4
MAGTTTQSNQSLYSPLLPDGLAITARAARSLLIQRLERLEALLQYIIMMMLPRRTRLLRQPLVMSAVISYLVTLPVPYLAKKTKS